MQDPRALANLGNLKSYRAWEQEGYRRSGFLMLVMSVPTMLAPVFIVATVLTTTLFEHGASGARVRAVLAGTAFAGYLVIAIGLMLFSILRLNAWRRAHPWAPPA